MSKELYGKLIYEKYIFDIPKLKDICAIYGYLGESTNETLSNLIENIFNSNKLYLNDLNASKFLVIASLDKIKDQLLIQQDLLKQ